MLSWFRKTPKTPAPHPTQNLQSLAKVLSIDDDANVPRYPPFAKGLPLVRAEQIMRSQINLIRRSRAMMHMGESEYDRLILPVVARLAEFAHLLPASEAHHHRGAGGLFRHSLEVGHYAIENCTGLELATGGTPSQDRAAKPRWQAAAYLSGILHDVGKPVRDMLISDASGARQWKPFSETLYQWGSRERLDRYFVAWRPGRRLKHEQFTVLVVDRVLTDEIRAWLLEVGPDIMEVMLATALGVDTNHPMDAALREADSTSTARDLPMALSLGDEASIAVPVETYVLDAMRRLVEDKHWDVNKPGSRVWVLKSGVYVVWKAAGKEIADLLAREKVKGIPRHPDTLAEMLIDRGHAVADTLPNGQRHIYHEVSPDLLCKDQSRRLRLHMLKLKELHTIFGHDAPPEAVDALIGNEIQAFEQKITMPSQPASADRPEAVQEKVAETPLAEVPEHNDPGIGHALDDAPDKEVWESLYASREDEQQEPSPARERPAPAQTPPLIESATTPEESPAQEQLIQASPREVANETPGWLIDQYGDAGQILLEGLSNAREHAGHLIIPYPQGLAGAHEPAAAATMLCEAGLIKPDPVTPQRRVRNIEGIKVLVIAPSVRDRLKTRSNEDAKASPGDDTSKKRNPDVIQAAEDLVKLIRLADPRFAGLKEQDGQMFVPMEDVRVYSRTRRVAISPLMIELQNRKDVKISNDGVKVSI